MIIKTTVMNKDFDNYLQNFEIVYNDISRVDFEQMGRQRHRKVHEISKLGFHLDKLEGIFILVIWL